MGDKAGLIRGAGSAPGWPTSRKQCLRTGKGVSRPIQTVSYLKCSRSSGMSRDIIRAHMPLALGVRLDSYEIVALLGAGGMGEVYRARDTTLKRDVAIKVLPEYWSCHPERLRRFKLEAQSLLLWWPTVLPPLRRRARIHRPALLFRCPATVRNLRHLKQFSASRDDGIGSWRRVLWPWCLTGRW